jgi:hypothetical protein
VKKASTLLTTVPQSEWLGLVVAVTVGTSTGAVGMVFNVKNGWLSIKQADGHTISKRAHDLYLVYDAPDKMSFVAPLQPSPPPPPSAVDPDPVTVAVAPSPSELEESAGKTLRRRAAQPQPPAITTDADPPQRATPTRASNRTAGALSPQAPQCVVEGSPVNAVSWEGSFVRVTAGPRCGQVCRVIFAVVKPACTLLTLKVRRFCVCAVHRV